LRERRELVEELRQRSVKERVTLVYAARDEEHNGALVLQQVLNGAKPLRAKSARRREA
jgi:uncharacterized protein YeaO (DUF488 family)